jgi:hypothetical protein
VSASNPAATSQIDIVATSDDPDDAAAIANAVADQFTGVVEELEQPGSGRSPVVLTVTNPATAPTGPVSPQALYVLVLGVVVGLFLGLAAAIVRSRIDTRVFSESDVRSAWGGDDEVPVLTTPGGRPRPGRLTGRPAGTLARRFEVLAEQAPTRIAVLSPAPAEQPAARALAAEVVDGLATLGVTGRVDGSPDAAARSAGATPAVRLEIADPLASLRVWRSVAATADGLVLVVPSGRVPADELRELRTVLDDAGIVPLAIVVTPRPTRRPWSRATPEQAAAGTRPGTGGGSAGQPTRGPLPSAASRR